jgi:hypothetical protein
LPATGSSRTPVTALPWVIRTPAASARRTRTSRNRARVIDTDGTPYTRASSASDTLDSTEPLALRNKER